MGRHKGNALTYDEITAEHQGGLAGDKKPGLGLKQLTVPNTIIAGQFAGKNLAASAVVIEGANLDTSEDIDQYRFRFEEGQFVNVEVQGWVKTNAVAFEDLVFTGLSISKDNGDGTLDRLITSWQEFEGYDPLIFDFEIQETGDYVLEVYAQKFFCSGTNCYYLDPYYPFLNYGEYDVLVYSIDRPSGPPWSGSNKSVSLSDFQCSWGNRSTNQKDTAFVAPQKNKVFDGLFLV